MKTIIENLSRLTWLDEGQKNALETKAKAHLRYSNITFQVMKADETNVIVQVIQLKHLSENYATAEHLVKVAESVFSTMLYGRKLKVGAKPYVPAPADVVTPEWVRNAMAKQRLKAVDLEAQLGIDKSTLSVLLSGKKEMTRAMKSMFYFFFLAKQLEQNQHENGI